MVEIIKKHIEDRKSVNTELKKIMRYCDDSPINLKFLNKKWGYRMGELYLQVKNYSLDEDYYFYEVSSLGSAGKEYFMGEKDGHTYVMAHEEGDWEATQIFVLDNSLKVDMDD